MNDENLLQVQNIRANSSGIENLRRDLLSLENKLNDTVKPALIKLSDTMQTLQNTLDHLGPLWTKVAQLGQTGKRCPKKCKHE